VDEVAKVRLAQNEAVFRSINEQVLALEERFESQEVGFLCECANAACSKTVFLRLDEYQRIHEDHRRFFVVPGHERPEPETTVERHPTYLVVEKKVPVPEV
jgi:hypothetical protein